MSRCLLHIRRLAEFRSWLDEQGIAHRPSSAEYQVIQVRYRGNWLSIFTRHHMPEHYSTDPRMDPLIRKFHRETRAQP